MKQKPKVAFVCTHNSCRSQMAEALGKKLAGDVFESFSAGTHIKDQINPTAVRLMKERYGIDMEETQHPKSIEDLPEIDVLVTMGCGVVCPFVPNEREEDWGLEDPSTQPDEQYIEVMQRIEDRILQLKEELKGRD